MTNNNDKVEEIKTIIEETKKLYHNDESRYDESIKSTYDQLDILFAFVMDKINNAGFILAHENTVRNLTHTLRDVYGNIKSKTISNHSGRYSNFDNNISSIVSNTNQIPYINEDGNKEAFSTIIENNNTQITNKLQELQEETNILRKTIVDLQEEKESLQNEIVEKINELQTLKKSIQENFETEQTNRETEYGKK